MSQHATDRPRRHRLSVADYYRMADAGILRPDQRVELIDGQIIDMPPIGSAHAGIVDQLAEIFRNTVGDRAIIRVQSPISLDEHSEPEPDVALLRRRRDFYQSAHPSPADVLLIVEIADSSLPFDRGVKVPLYARHEIGEVWLMDAKRRELTRYRRPAEGRYTLVDRPDLTTPLTIGAMPDAEVPLAALNLR